MTQTKSISEILTGPQIKELEKKVKEMESKGLKPMDPDFTKGLKELFGQWKDQLLAKGVDSNYLAYAVSYVISQGGKP